MGMCVSKVEEAKTSNQVMTPCNDEDKSTLSGNLPRSQNHKVTSFRDPDSQEEMFFDSQPWLNSDSEDDFLSVNGDFIPSCGSTPVHPSFVSQIPPFNKSSFDENKLGLNSERPPSGKKSLSDLFRDSIRIVDYPDGDGEVLQSGQNGSTVKDEDFKRNEKSRKFVRCCIPLPSHRSKYFREG